MTDLLKNNHILHLKKKSSQYDFFLNSNYFTFKELQRMI